MPDPIIRSYEVQDVSGSHYQAQAAASDLPIPKSISDITNEAGLQPPSNIYLGIGKELGAKDPDGYKDAKGYFDWFMTFNFPKSWNEFEAGWNKYLKDLGIPSTPGGLYEGLVRDFAAAMGLQLDSSNNIIGGDWAALSPPLTLTDPTSPYNPLTSILDAFIIKLNTLKPRPSTGEAFVQEFQKFAHDALGGVLMRDGKAYIDPTAPNQDFFKDKKSFEDYYKRFAPYPSDEELEKLLNEFYIFLIQNHGSFLPLEKISGDWLNFVKANASREAPPVEEIPDDDKIGQDRFLLNRILELLIKLIGTLQEVAIVQSQHLDYLTDFQKFYSALQMALTTFKKGSSDPLGRDDDDTAKLRNELNQEEGVKVIEELRILRESYSDEAKKVQSRINTTTDAVNQQTDMLTTFLQQLTTLFSAIFR